VDEIRAVFVDRDGTINEEHGYVHCMADFRLLPGTMDALKLFTQKGIKIFVITNQAGIAKGLYTEAAFRSFTEEMVSFLNSQGIVIEEVLYCPHHPDGTVPKYSRVCGCRKPGTELIEKVMEEESLEREEIVVIGDKESDIEAGHRLGCRTYLVLTGYGADYQWNTKATCIVNDLLDAAKHLTRADYGRDSLDEKVDAIILAGGLGTRLREVTSDLPKVLAPVRGKPFLDIILHSLNAYGFIRRVVIAVGYMSEKIISHYGGEQPYRFEIAFSIERELLGTGGGIKRALKLTSTSNVLVLNGDSYVETDLNQLCWDHKTKGADMTIVLKSVDDAGRFGMVSLDRDSRVVNFEEKKERSNGTALQGIVNAGVYLLDRSLFDGVEDGIPVSLERELFPAILGKKIYGHVSKGKFIDIGTPESFRMADSYLQEVQGE
jgi:D,D-heptose 1,7-bisphosphate phosphatase